MLNSYYFLFIGVIVSWSPVYALWSCSVDVDCSSLAGSICLEGTCLCPTGTQIVAGGSLCASVAPYHTSVCVEDHQCQRLFTGFECRKEQGAFNGTCQCQTGHHFLQGRCWRSRGYGESCSRHEECLGVIRDLNSLACDGVCGCADGFFERQRGECRRAGLAVGDGCVLDQDCRFPGGVCNVNTFTCHDGTSVLKLESEERIVKEIDKMAESTIKMAAAQHGAACDVTNPCDSPLVCSTFGVCVCPLGYYANDNATICLAELESPATSEQCVGLFSTLIDGVCTCPPNFFFQESMRDCVKVARFITDACVTDSSCHTFGAAARCGPALPPWGLRACECIPELAVWDRDRSMCRLFAGIGEACQVDSDCLAGELEVQCRPDEEGNGFCACPDGLTEFQGLCIATDLGLGEACQVSEECTGTAHALCTLGRCACADGYQQLGDVCAPVIGGRCVEDTDCVIEHTVCRENQGLRTCQCGGGFVQDQDVCWPVVAGHHGACNVSAQCPPSLGVNSQCVDGRCACAPNHHHRDGWCWPKTGLFERCSRHSECFLGAQTDRVVCRNSLCQCDFRYPYSEQTNTCKSSASTIITNFTLIIALLTMLINNNNNNN